MSQSLEQLKKEINALRPAERYELWRDLSAEFEPAIIQETDTSVEDAWDQEIEVRMREVEEGKVQLISMEESDRQIAELFAKRGIRLDKSAQ